MSAGKHKVDVVNRGGATLVLKKQMKMLPKVALSYMTRKYRVGTE